MMNKITTELEKIIGSTADTINNINFNTLVKDVNFDIVEFDEIYHNKAVGVRNTICLYRSQVLQKRTNVKILEFKNKLIEELSKDNLKEIVKVLKELFITDKIRNSSLEKLGNIYKKNEIDILFKYYLEHKHLNLCLLLKSNFKREKLLLKC
jgi:hypothetical protein